MKLSLLCSSGRLLRWKQSKQLITVMTLTAFLIVFACLHVAGASHAQKVTISLKDVSIQKVFQEVVLQADVSIVYDDAYFKDVKRVSIDVQDASPGEVVRRCLAGLPYTYIQEGNSLVIRPSAEGMHARTSPTFDRDTLITVRGRVVNEKGEPIEGATMSVKGTKRGTTTDESGNFILPDIHDTSVLVISGIDIETQEVVVSGKTFIAVRVIQTATEMNAAVVIGYGTVRKRDLTGAVSVIKGDMVDNNAVPQIGQALQGKIAGLQIRQTSGAPNAGVEIRIRGMGTFGAQVDPLVVVDGIITKIGLNDIDPSNIEDITVLKDASAAAIYGSRGANGVVLVTTKRGRSGKSVVDFQTFYSIDKVIRKIPTVDAATYGAMVNDYYTNQGRQAPFENPASLGAGTNWQDQIFTTGGKQNYALSVSGGTEKALYALTMSYYRGDGIVVNSRYDRGNFRVNTDVKPFKGAKIGSSLGISFGSLKGGNSQEAIDRSLIYAPTVKPYNEDGTYGIANRAGEPTTMVQPLVAAYERNVKEKNIRMLGNVYVEYEILKGLTFRNNWGIEYHNFDGSRFTPSYNFGLGNINGTAILDRNTHNTRNWMVDNILSYKKRFGGLHDLDVMVGHTFQEERFEDFTGHTESFLRNDENLQVPFSGTAVQRVGGNITVWAIQSFLGRLNYSYKSKYLLTSNLRVDQSSRFAKDNRVGVFPSLSAAWVLSEEGFFDNFPSVISFLKLRAGYGVLGNQNIAIYPYQSIMNSNLFYSLGSDQTVHPGVAATALSNPNIRWEQTQTFGGGLEANFFSDKLRVVVDYYNRYTTDILTQVPLPDVSGLNTVLPYQNVAKVRNTGVEFSVDYQNSNSTGDFQYNVGLNFSVNKNRVTELSKGSEIVFSTSRIAQGRQIMDYYGYIHDGIFQNTDEIAKSAFQPNVAPGDIRFRDLNNDAVINDQDRTYIGSSLGKQFLGFNGGVKYKNFDLIIAVNGDFGRDMIISVPGFALTRGAEQTNAMFYDRWTGPGTSNWVPRLVGGDPNSNSRISTFWLASQDYLRIQNVQIGYDFSEKMLRTTGVGRLRVYVAVQNLATITKFPGFDPEMSANGYPIARSVFIGINLGLH